MAISINWPTGVIFVPRADLTLKQSSPVEIREMNLNWFRLQLKDLEDSDAGMPFLKTHLHNTEVQLGGLVFARVIEILPPYTVTFEDGQYTVDLVGANSNVGDRINPNQVSVRSYNSAGLISNSAIEYASFNGGVTVDITSEFSGTTYPIGTPQQPVNNMVDALLIAEVRGFTTFFIIGNVDLDSGLDYSDYIFIGESPGKTLINISSAANVARCEFYEATLTGTLDGDSALHDCIVTNLDYVNGEIHNCLLEGTIVLGGNAKATIINSTDGLPGLDTPIIDLGGSGQELGIWGWHGGVTLRNKTGADSVSVNLDVGRVILEDTVVSGLIIARGIGSLTDQYGNHISAGSWNGCTIVNELISQNLISEAVWDEPLTDHTLTGTTGRVLSLTQFAGSIYVDSINGQTGTDFPTGTYRVPVNNFTDAIEIANKNGIKTLSIMHSEIADRNWGEYILQGAHYWEDNFLNLNGYDFNSTNFRRITLSGQMSGEIFAEDCYVDGIKNLKGEIINSRVTGDITVSSGGYFSGIGLVFEGDFTTIDFQNQPCTVSLDIDSGYLMLKNMVNGCLAEFNLRGGELELDSSCTGGDLYLEGYGTLFGDPVALGLNVKANHLLALETIPPHIWNSFVNDYLNNGTFGKELMQRSDVSIISSGIWTSLTNDYTTAGTLGSDIATVADIANLSTVSGISADIDYLKTMADANYTLIQFISDLESGKQVLINNQLICYAPDNTTELIRFNLFDSSGSPTTDNVYRRDRV